MGNPNSESFTNEVIINFNDITALNRIAYAARQDSAKEKGFAQEFEVYSSLTSEADNFEFVYSRRYSEFTGGIVETKFNSTKFKRIKFKFKKANQNWALA